MPCSMIDAHNQIIALLVDALPGDLPTKFPDMATAPGFPPSAGPWARVSIADTEPPRPPPLCAVPGSRRYWMSGVVMVELYTLSGDGRSASQVLGETVLAAFRGKSTTGGVTFKRERVNPVGADGIWWHENAIIEYEYSTLG